MEGRKPAPHVARSIAAAQAKPSQQVGRNAAQPKAAGAPGVRPPASHVAAALARVAAPPAAALPKILPATAPAAPRAPHVAAALAASRSAQPKAGPARPQVAAHVAAAAERRGAPPPPAGVVQRSQAAWLKRKQAYVDGTAEGNKAIKTLTGSSQNYFDLSADVPADVKVAIHGQPRSGPLNLNRDASQMVNFSYSLKELQSVEPELQTALIRNTTSATIDKIRLSANTSTINSGIRKLTKTRNLGKLYRKEIRPFHVTRRRAMLEREAAKVGKRDLRKILDEVKERKKGKARVSFDRGVNKRLAALLHARTKKEEARKRMKSARGFALDPRYTGLPVHVPDNTDNIHAESAIEAETETQPNEEIAMVYGTKVPCLACQAFFQGKGVRNLLMDHSSFAWLSESSLKQLGFKKDEIKDYLLHIRSTLGTLGLNEYGVSSGEISIADLTVDDDPASDSEDEDARSAFDYRKVGSGKKKPSKKDLELQTEIEKYGKHFP